jgi:hypothetical protein
MSVLNRLFLLAFVLVSIHSVQADPLLEEIIGDYRKTLPTSPKRAQSIEEACVWRNEIYL